MSIFGIARAVEGEDRNILFVREIFSNWKGNKLLKLPSYRISSDWFTCSFLEKDGTRLERLTLRTDLMP